MKRYLLETVIFTLLSLFSVGLLVFITFVNPLTFDMALHFKNHQYFGGEARAIGWLTLLVSSCCLVYLAILSFVRLKKPSYGDPKYRICQDCGEPLIVRHIKKSLICPKCGSGKIEELDGFYERHPDKRIE